MTLPLSARVFVVDHHKAEVGTRHRVEMVSVLGGGKLKVEGGKL